MLEELREMIAKAAGVNDFQLEPPEFEELGHLASNAAFYVAKKENVSPMEAAKSIREDLLEVAPQDFIKEIEVKEPGFLNFWMTEKAIQAEAKEILDNPRYGFNEAMKGKTVMVEFTDPNPFKLFHIGHLMSNAIGESISRLYEAMGAKVVRVNYQGDVGLHVAKAVWGMKHNAEKMPHESADLAIKMDFLGKVYALGSKQYDEDSPEAKREIIKINEEIYSKSNPEINELYDTGLKWSLEYFKAIYHRLGTKFEHYFFESEVGGDGLSIVQAHPDIFVESKGAVIFPGENYGLHTRVFINSNGLPTYETKELGLNREKFRLYPSTNLSIIITGNEIKDYFKVLMKAMTLVMPEVADKTRHLPHGMLRLSSGKMSSRTGDVITADSLLEQITEKLSGYVSARVELDPAEQELVLENMAIGSIKYSILRQNFSQDIVFDFDKSLSVEGDSAPYLFYAYTRLRSILSKAEHGKADPKHLSSKGDLALILKLSRFQEVIRQATNSNSPHYIAGYLYELAKTLNRFYENEPVLKADPGVREARLALINSAANVMKDGLNLLGIKVPEKI